ncbi:Uncharacterized protein OBRU01_12284 [Operophtera brumata]|uniref:Uncharacterized protein n=1 Tax=Operophtera brumata TaxID=104452 RepID=A0A0L7L6V4_OPEBR|nr:Uncharacterized protein OBRU01_12284 [Operophtera brumata]
MVIDLWQHQEGTWPGFLIVIDLEKVTLSHLARLDLQTVQQFLYFLQLRAVSLESARAPLASRAKAALSALLPTAPAPLQSVACRAARNRLSNWINDHWNTTAVLCKDIESEMKTLMSLNEMRVASEHICLLLDGDACGDIAPILTACAGAASNNNIFCRAPTQRALMQLSVDLCLVYVSKKPKEVTEPFLLKLHAIWNTCCPDRKHYTPENVSVMERREDLSPDLRNFTDDRLPTPISDEETHSETCANGVEGIDPNTRGIDPNSRGIDPNSRGIGPNSRGIDLNTRGIDPNSRAIDPNSRGTDPNSRGIDSNSRGIDPITRGIDPSSRGIDPNSRGTDPNSRGIDPNSRGIDPNSRGIDPNTRGIDKNKRGIDSNVRGIDTKTKGIDSSTQVPICVNTRALCSDTKSVDLISKTEPKSPNCKVNSKPVTPLKRVSLISQPISPKPTSPNTRFHPTIAANAHSLDPNTRKVDSTTKSESKVDQNMTFEESNEHLLEYFDRILCPRNIVMLSASKSQQSDVWEALAIMMVFLLKNDYLRCLAEKEAKTILTDLNDVYQRTADMTELCEEWALAECEGEGWWREAREAGAGARGQIDARYAGAAPVERAASAPATAIAVRSALHSAKSLNKKLQRVNLDISAKGIIVTDADSQDNVLSVSIYK